MNRWLLHTFSTWELGLIVVGGFVLLALVGLALLHRFAPSLRQSENNDVAGVILGVLAAIYGIVLAFVIVSLYDDFRTTQGDIRTEASALAMVYRDTRVFAPASAAQIKREVGAYVGTVTHKEWPDLAEGRESPEAWTELNSMYVTLQHYTPKSVPQQVFYSEAVARVNDLAASRRERLNDAEEGIPPTFEVLLVGGAVLMLFFTLLFGVRSFRLHAVMAVSVAALIGFNLLLALVLDFPFAGKVSVSPAPFSQGALVVFAAEGR